MTATKKPRTRTKKPAYEQRINEKDGTVLIKIPGGYPILGSNNASDEGPPRQAYIPEFWIARDPVTVAQFKRFCDEAGHSMPTQAPWSTDDHPVVNVSWNDAVAYCKWAGLRLPSENEWEYAARGEDGRTYPWGNSKPTAARAVFASTHAEPVGGRPKGNSPFGVRDMAGNVWEWTASCYHDDRWHHPPLDILDALAASASAPPGDRPFVPAPPSACAEAAAGTSTPGSAARPTASGTCRRTAAAASASAPPGDHPFGLGVRTHTPSSCSGAAAGTAWPGTAAPRAAAGTTTTISPPIVREPTSDSVQHGDIPFVLAPSACSGAAAGAAGSGAAAPRSATRIPPPPAAVRPADSEQQGDIPFVLASSCTGAEAGTTRPGTAAPRSATGSAPASGSTDSASAQRGDHPFASTPAACSGAAAGTARPGTAAPRSAAGTAPASGTTSSASGQQGDLPFVLARAVCSGVAAGPSEPGSATPRTAKRTAAEPGTATTASGQQGDIPDSTALASARLDECENRCRAFRGGGWSDDWWSCDSTARDQITDQSFQSHVMITDIGFRTAGPLQV